MDGDNIIMVITSSIINSVTTAIEGSVKPINGGEITEFNPADVAPVRAWLDADDADTITEASGSVSQWADKSGNDYHFIQDNGSGLYQPATGTNTLNSKNVISFGGSAFLYNTADATNLHTGEGTVFVVSNAAGGNDDDVLYYIMNSASEDAGSQFNGQGGVDVMEIYMAKLNNKTARWLHQDNIGLGKREASLPDTAETQILFCDFEFSSAGLFGNDSGDTDTLSGNMPASLNYTPAQVRLGAHGSTTNNTSRWLTGDIAEVIVFDEVLSTADKNTIGEYLADKWGMSWTEVT